MSYGQQRDLEDSVLDGSVKVPHESFDALIAMVRDQLRQGAPNVSWAIDGVAEGQELPANVEAALRAFFDEPTMQAASELRARVVELADPEDMADQLSERSENISNALDAAFERGQDAYDRFGDRDAIAAHYFDHVKLRAAFCDGWEDAASYDDDDSYCCSQDRSMRDTHGSPSDM
jgi:hypothetical protein